VGKLYSLLEDLQTNGVLMNARTEKWWCLTCLQTQKGKQHAGHLTVRETPTRRHVSYVQATPRTYRELETACNLSKKQQYFTNLKRQGMKA